MHFFCASSQVLVVFENTYAVLSALVCPFLWLTDLILKNSDKKPQSSYIFREFMLIWRTIIQP